MDKKKLQIIKAVLQAIESNGNLSVADKNKISKLKAIVEKEEVADKFSTIEDNLNEHLDDRFSGEKDEFKPLVKEFKDIIAKSKSEMSDTFSGLRQKTLDAINNLFIKNDVNKKLEEKLNETNKLFARIDEKMAKVRDGKDVDEKRVIEAVLSQIEPPKDVKDADETKIIENVLKKIEIPKVDYSKLESFEEKMREELRQGKRIMTPAKPTGSKTTVDTTNFNNLLSSADDTVQKALDTLDNVALSGYIPYGINVDLGAYGLTATYLSAPIIKPAADSVTALQITKADGTTNIMNFDTTNGRVGIGTAAPTDLFVVNGVLRVTSTLKLSDGSLAACSLAHRADENTGMYFPANDKMSFVTASVDRLLIDDTGKVGIGITVPTQLLDVGLADGSNGIVANFLGGAAGTNIITLTRTSGVSAVAGIGLPSGRLGFTLGSSAVLGAFYGDPGAGNMPQVLAGQDLGSNTLAGYSGMLRAINAGTTGTDTVGGNLYIASGKGNGAGVGSTIFFQTPDAIASGTTQQSYTTKASVEATGIHIGIHNSGAGTSTYVPLFLYDNYGAAVKFVTQKMANSSGYNLILPDPTIVSEDFIIITGGGKSKQVAIFNDNNNIESSAAFGFNTGTNTLSVGDSINQGKIALTNSTRTTTLAAGFLTGIITLPASLPGATSVLNISSAGVMATYSVTGSANVVMSTSPTITTPNITTSILLTRNNLITTPNYGFYARNATAATSGVPVQISPNEQLSGAAWDGAASETSIFRSYVIPVTGTNPTTSYRIWGASVDGAGYVESFKQWDNGDLEIVDANDIILGTTTGTKIGTATTQKLAFYNSTPIVKPTALTTALTTLTYTAPGTPDYALQDVTNTTPYGFVDAEELRTFISVVKNLQDRVNDLETKLQSLGLIA